MLLLMYMKGRKLPGKHIRLCDGNRAHMLALGPQYIHVHPCLHLTDMYAEFGFLDHINTGQPIDVDLPEPTSDKKLCITKLKVSLLFTYHRV